VKAGQSLSQLLRCYKPEHSKNKETRLEAFEMKGLDSKENNK